MKYSLLTKQCFFKLSWISLSLKKKIKTNLHSLLMNKEQQRKTPKQRENKIVGRDRYILILYTTWWIFLSYSKKWEKNIFTPLLLQCFEGVHHLFLFYYSKGRTLDSLSQAKERKTQFSITFFCVCYLFKYENGIGKCFKLEISNNSTNLWSETRAFAAAKRWYSSKTDDKHHFCSFL